MKRDKALKDGYEWTPRSRVRRIDEVFSELYYADYIAAKVAIVLNDPLEQRARLTMIKEITKEVWLTMPPEIVEEVTLAHEEHKRIFEAAKTRAKAKGKLDDSPRTPQEYAQYVMIPLR